MNRYNNEKVIEHLASHYVLGSMSTLVKNKTERLIKEIPELEQSVYRWQQKESAGPFPARGGGRPKTPDRVAEGNSRCLQGSCPRST